MLNANPRLSARALQRHLEITYKAAWQLRKVARAELLFLEDYFDDRQDDPNQPDVAIAETGGKAPRMGRKVVFVSMIRKFANRLPDSARKDLTRLALQH
jgi:hypothetical protein